MPLALCLSKIVELLRLKLLLRNRIPTIAKVHLHLHLLLVGLGRLTHNRRKLHLHLLLLLLSHVTVMGSSLRISLGLSATSHWIYKLKALLLLGIHVNESNTTWGLLDLFNIGRRVNLFLTYRL